MKRKKSLSTADVLDGVSLFQLNLASQSVLEGLSACLDHRAEVSHSFSVTC